MILFVFRQNDVGLSVAGWDVELVPELRSCHNRWHSQQPVQPKRARAGIKMGPSTSDIITSFENDQKNMVFSALRYSTSDPSVNDEGGGEVVMVCIYLYLASRGDYISKKKLHYSNNSDLNKC